MEIHKHPHRLIRNKNIVDSILAYTSSVQRTLINQADLITVLKELTDLRFQIINYHAFLRQRINTNSKIDSVGDNIEYLQTHDKRN